MIQRRRGTARIDRRLNPCLCPSWSSRSCLILRSAALRIRHPSRGRPGRRLASGRARRIAGLALTPRYSQGQ